MKNNIITLTKAIGIILMVMAHAQPPFIIRQIIVMFHMPLFFFVSGFCLKSKYIENSTFLFILKRIKGLWWPFVKYSIIFLLLHNLFFELNLYNDHYGYLGTVSNLYNIQEIIKRTIGILFYMGGNEQLLGGYWFLRALFWGSIISIIALRILKYHSIVLIFLVTCLFLLNYTQYYIPVIHISAQPFAAAIFFTIGYIFSIKKVSEFNIYYIIGSFIVTIIGSFYWRTAIVYDFYDNKIIFIYTATAIIATWAIYSLLSKLKRIKKDNIFYKLCLYIGNHTLDILTWHFICFKIVSLILINIYKIDKQRLAEFPVISELSEKGWWILYFIMGIICPVTLVYIYRKLKIIYNQI